MAVALATSVSLHDWVEFTEQTKDLLMAPPDPDRITAVIQLFRDVGFNKPRELFGVTPLEVPTLNGYETLPMPSRAYVNRIVAAIQIPPDHPSAGGRPVASPQPRSEIMDHHRAPFLSIMGTDPDDEAVQSAAAVTSDPMEVQAVGVKRTCPLANLDDSTTWMDAASPSTKLQRAMPKLHWDYKKCALSDQGQVHLKKVTDAFNEGKMRQRGFSNVCKKSTVHVDDWKSYLEAKQQKCGKKSAEWHSYQELKYVSHANNSRKVSLLPNAEKGSKFSLSVFAFVMVENSKIQVLEIELFREFQVCEQDVEVPLFLEIADALIERVGFGSPFRKERKKKQKRLEDQIDNIIHDENIMAHFIHEVFGQTLSSEGFAWS